MKRFSVLLLLLTFFVDARIPTTGLTAPYLDRLDEANVVYGFVGISKLISVQAVLSAATESEANQAVYLHYDYMVAADHSHKPDALAVQIVVDAFAAHGVDLIIDPIHHAIPEKKVVTLWPAAFSCSGEDAASIQDLRAQYFPTSNCYWHYCIFAHYAECPDASHCSACPPDPATGGTFDPTFAGHAELPGDNLIIAMANTNGTLANVASTFMHELGHNFGLQHGGNESVNNKPNYVSVMNYGYQLNGIVQGVSPGSLDIKPCSSGCVPGTYCQPDVIGNGFDYCFRVDYSFQNLPGLNELNHLDESVGVGGPVLNADLIFFWTTGVANLIGASNGSPIDWNGNGIIDTNVLADINNDGTYTYLPGFDDWSYVHEVLTQSPMPLTSIISAYTNVSCYKGNDGSSTVNTSGGILPYTYLWSNGETTSTIQNLTSATYTVTVMDNNSCATASSVTITEPAEIDIGITPSDAALSANATADSYQWLDCDNSFAAINGEVNQSFTPTMTGNYAVIISHGVCVDSSACVGVTIVGITSPTMEGISVYPNPVSNELIIEINSMSKNANFEIFNSMGHIVCKGNLTERTIVQTAGFSHGIYLIKFELGKTFELRKIVIE